MTKVAMQRKLLFRENVGRFLDEKAEMLHGKKIWLTYLLHTEYKNVAVPLYVVGQSETNTT